MRLKLPISLPIGCNRFNWLIINSSNWHRKQDGWHHLIVLQTQNITTDLHFSYGNKHCVCQRWWRGKNIKSVLKGNFPGRGFSKVSMCLKEHCFSITPEFLLKGYLLKPWFKEEISQKQNGGQTFYFQN